MDGRGINDPVGFKNRLLREIQKHTVPRHVRAGAADKFLILGFFDQRNWKVDALDVETLRRKVANAVEAQQGVQDG